MSARTGAGAGVGAKAAAGAGIADALPHEQRRARRPATDARLERPRSGRRIGGVAAGIADFVGARPITVRALWLASVPLSLGITAIGYVLVWLLMPAAPRSRGPSALG